MTVISALPSNLSDGLDVYEKDNHSAYIEIKTALESGSHVDESIRDQIQRIADNLEKRLDLLGKGEKSANPQIDKIASMIAYGLKVRGLAYAVKTLYKDGTLPDKYKQKEYDHSSIRNLTYREGDKELEDFTFFYQKAKDALVFVKKLDPHVLLRPHIQDMVHLSDQLSVIWHNHATEFKIPVVDTEEDQIDNLRKNSKYNTHQKQNYPDENAENLLVQDADRGIEIFTKFKELFTKLPPPKEKEEQFHLGFKAFFDFLDPYMDRKHHADWQMWAEISFNAQHYNLNHVSRMTEITDDNGKQRGLTKECIRDRLKSKEIEKFFRQFVYNIPFFLELPMWYRETLKYNYGLTTRMVPRMQHAA